MDKSESPGEKIPEDIYLMQSPLKINGVVKNIENDSEGLKSPDSVVSVQD